MSDLDDVPPPGAPTHRITVTAQPSCRSRILADADATESSGRTMIASRKDNFSTGSDCRF